MKRRAALWCLGFWAMGTIAVAVAATESFAVVDRLLGTLPNAEFGTRVGEMGSDAARELLRYLSSEVNRTFFGLWGWTQLPLSALVLWLVWGEKPLRIRYGVVAMLILAGILAFVLTPPIVSIGRALDFVPRDPAPPELATFGLLHAAYSVAEFAKLGMGLLVSFWLLRPTPDHAERRATSALG